MPWKDAQLIRATKVLNGKFIAKADYVFGVIKVIVEQDPLGKFMCLRIRKASGHDSFLPQPWSRCGDGETGRRGEGERDRRQETGAMRQETGDRSDPSPVSGLMPPR